MSKSIKIGLTGGIGSGKSVVAKIFKTIGIPVFEADHVAKEILNSNPEVKEKISHLFGEGFYTQKEGLNRKKLADLVFNDQVALSQLNGIIHPLVRNEFNTWWEKQHSPYIIHEAAILFETGFYKMMDYSILVVTNKDTRIQRVMKRDNVLEKDVLRRMEKQWDDEKKQGLADTIILNNNEMLITQVLEIDKKIREHGKIW